MSYIDRLFLNGLFQYCRRTKPTGHSNNVSNSYLIRANVNRAGTSPLKNINTAVIILLTLCHHC